MLPPNNKSMMMNTRPGRIDVDFDKSETPSNYAFFFFKRIEVTKATKDTLQGVDLHGHPIKSESNSEAGTGWCGAEAEAEESGSKIERQEPGSSSSSNSSQWEWWDRGASHLRRMKWEGEQCGEWERVERDLGVFVGFHVLCWVSIQNSWISF